MQGRLLLRRAGGLIDSALMAAAAPHSRDGFLDARLRDLLPYWLELRCDPARCTKTVCTPLRMLAAKRGGQLRLQDVIARLRCSQCGQAPVHAAITDSPIGENSNSIAEGAKWSVIVLP